MREVAIQQHDVWAALGGGVNDFHCIRIDTHEEWVDTRDLKRFTRLWDGAAQEPLDARVSLVPCWECSWHLPAEGNVLWAVGASPKARDNLSNWRYQPTMQIQWGKWLMALWALQQPLAPRWVKRLNERIAHNTHCQRKWGARLHMMMPLPGTRGMFDNEWHVVRCVGWSGELYSAKALCGNLPDAPDPDAWRRRVQKPPEPVAQQEMVV